MARRDDPINAARRHGRRRSQSRCATFSSHVCNPRRTAPRAAARRRRRRRATHLAAAPGSCLCSTDVTGLQRHPAFGRTAHRQLPRRGAELGRSAQYESFISVVDYHAITRRTSRSTRSAAAEMAVSLLAAGIDPRCAPLRAVACAGAYRAGVDFNTVAPLGELERRRNSRTSPAAGKVPAGPPQLSRPAGGRHPALSRRLVPVGRTRCSTRAVARNRATMEQHSPDTPRPKPREGFFPEPKPLLTPTRRIMGLDGRQDVQVAWQYRGPARNAGRDLGEAASGSDRSEARRATDPGTPEICNIYHLHKALPRRRPWSKWPRSAGRRGGAAWTARRCCSRT